jgi:hypothetical protein
MKLTTATPIILRTNDFLGGTEFRGLHYLYKDDKTLRLVLAEGKHTLAYRLKSIDKINPSLAHIWYYDGLQIIHADPIVITFICS